MSSSPHRSSCFSSSFSFSSAAQASQSQDALFRSTSVWSASSHRKTAQQEVLAQWKDWKRLCTPSPSSDATTVGRRPQERPAILVLPPPLFYISPVPLPREPPPAVDAASSLESSLPPKAGAPFTDTVERETCTMKENSAPLAYDMKLHPTGMKDRITATRQHVVSWLTEQFPPCLEHVSKANTQIETGAAPSVKVENEEQQPTHHEKEDEGEAEEERMADVFLMMHLTGVKTAPCPPFTTTSFFDCLFFTSFPLSSPEEKEQGEETKKEDIAMTTGMSDLRITTWCHHHTCDRVRPTVCPVSSSRNFSDVPADPPSLPAPPAGHEKQLPPREAASSTFSSSPSPLPNSLPCSSSSLLSSSPSFTIAALVGFTYQVGFILLYQRVYCDGCGYPVHPCWIASRSSSSCCCRGGETKTFRKNENKTEHEEEKTRAELTASRVDFRWLQALVEDCPYRRCFIVEEREPRRVCPPPTPLPSSPSPETEREEHEEKKSNDPHKDGVKVDEEDNKRAENDNLHCPIAPFRHGSFSSSGRERRKCYESLIALVMDLYEFA